MGKKSYMEVEVYVTDLTLSHAFYLSVNNPEFVPPSLCQHIVRSIN